MTSKVRPKNIVGYGNRTGVRPGETIDFMVGAYVSGRYSARIVRLSDGQHVPSPIDGDYPAREQSIHPGSFALVSEIPATPSLTLQAMIWPTTPGGRRQAICTRGGDPRAGFSLYLNEAGELVGSVDGAELSTGLRLRGRRWYGVSASYDASTGRLVVEQFLLHATLAEPAAEASRRVEKEIGPGRDTGGDQDVAFAAWKGSTATGFLNGKIDAPRLCSRALSREEIRVLWAAEPPSELSQDLVGFWDFARGIGGEQVHDLSNAKRHGYILQLPTRGVTGWRWDGSEQDWKRAPDHYGAIHFHEDDLADAGWETSASLVVPAEWKSGVYALRVELDGDSDSIPFFVLPARGVSKNRVHFLASTATYAAYANQTLHLAPGVFGDGEIVHSNDATLLAHPEYGRSLYCHHSDGSGVHYSSLRRPVMNFRPEGMLWAFSADLDIVAWLEQAGIAYDVGTDDDLHLEGESVLPEGGVVVTGTHPEYWSTPMRDALERWLERGGRLIYMGGNGFYWRIAFHPGRSDTVEVRRAEDGTRAWISEPGEYYQSWGGGEYGGLWRRLGRPPNELVGVGFTAQGFEQGTFYRRHEASRNPRASFLFEGVQSDDVIGDYGTLGGAAGQEIDRYDERIGSPSHALVLASSHAHPPSMLRVKEEFFATTPLGEDPNVRADLCFFETAAGGAVFSTGSIAWASSLSHENFENDVARITSNALRRFVDPTPFSMPPHGRG